MVNPQENIVPESQLESETNLPENQQPEELPEGWVKTSDVEGIRKRFLLRIADSNRQSYPTIIHAVGYLLLFLAFLDFLQILFPPQFTNANWELETMGQLVERVAIPLLGYLFAFFPSEGEVSRFEFWMWRFLSWLALVLGICYLLLLPIGFHNTLRVDQQNVARINAQINQQNQQLQQQKQAISQLQDQQLDTLLKNLQQQNQAPNIKSPEQLQEQLLTQLQRSEEMTKTQAESFRKNQRIALLKTSFKWNLGALLSGVMFIVIWRLTSWARGGK